MSTELSIKLNTDGLRQELSELQDEARRIGVGHIASIRNWFALAVPTPTDKNRAVQVGCHFEEVGEMLDAMGESHHGLDALASGYKSHTEVEIDDENLDRKMMLDALCDQIVTAVGVAHMFGMDIEGALTEVNRSNWSKFVDGKPVFDANGKIAKPATYSKPNLTPFV